MKSKKGKLNRNKVLLMIFLIAAVFAVLKIYEHYWINKAHFVRYPAFGIDIPENYSIHGIDVSKYQSYIDWESVRDMKVKKIKIGFAFIKATEGLGRVDGQFRRNWLKVKEAGVTRGAYHFFIATKSGKAQAENFLSAVDFEKGDMLPVLDVEETYGATDEQLQKGVKEWLQTVEKQLHVKPIIYSNVSFYKNRLGKDFDDYPLWAAHYLQKDKPDIERKWIFWQYSESGHVNGILGNVDFNAFYGDSSAFRKWRIQ
jgi:lysozyme